MTTTLSWHVFTLGHHFSITSLAPSCHHLYHLLIVSTSSPLLTSPLPMATHASFVTTSLHVIVSQRLHHQVTIPTLPLIPTPLLQHHSSPLMINSLSPHDCLFHCFIIPSSSLHHHLVITPSSLAITPPSRQLPVSSLHCLISLSLHQPFITT